MEELFEAENSEPAVEILRNGGKDAQFPTRFEGVRKLEFDGMKERIREIEKTRILDDFRAVLLIAHDGMACHSQVAADLVGSSRFDADGQMGSQLVAAQAVNIGEGAFAIQGEVDCGGNGVPLSIDDGPIGFADEMFLERPYDCFVRFGRFGEQEASGRIAIEAVRGLQFCDSGLRAKECFEGELGLIDDDSAWFVGNEEKFVFKEDADLFGAVGTGSRRRSESGQGDMCAGVEAMMGHPDALSVHAHDPGVDLLFRGPFRNTEMCSEEILQGNSFLATGDKKIFLAFWQRFHRRSIQHKKER